MVLISSLLEPEKASLAVQQTGSVLYCSLEATAHRGSGNPSWQEPFVSQSGLKEDVKTGTSHQGRMALWQDVSKQILII